MLALSLIKSNNEAPVIRARLPPCTRATYLYRRDGAPRGPETMAQPIVIATSVAGRVGAMQNVQSWVD